MMEKLKLNPGDYVRIESVSLPKGKRVTLRLLDRALLAIQDVKSAFEKQLKNFIVLAEGDRVPFVHNRVEYQIEIVKCEPECVIDINNTNLEIDFAPMEGSLEEGHEENGGNKGNERRDVNVNRNLEEERR
ncbi:hypothetical protein WA538_004153, partial [Blastocystis sp. DL]